MRAFNNQGQSLVQVLISVATFGLLMSIMATFQYNQSRENKALSEKLTALDLKRTLEVIVNNPASCGNLLQAANIVGGNSTFDSTSTATPIGVIQLDHISDLSGTNVAKNGMGLPDNSSMVPTSIQFIVTSPSTASLSVQFNQGLLVRALRSITLTNIAISTTPAGGSLVQITGCDGVGAAGGASAGGSSPSGWTCALRSDTQTIRAGDPSVTATALCQGSEKFISGSCDGLTEIAQGGAALGGPPSIMMVPTTGFMTGRTGTPGGVGWGCKCDRGPCRATAYCCE